jgi:hypothetical protein
MTAPLPPIPAGLSPESASLWKALTTRHRFADFELVTFRKALEWFDRADALCADADRADGRESAALLKQAMDASCCGLRFWRQLKFTGGEAARRPGRPSGDLWSAKRQAQKLAKVV